MRSTSLTDSLKVARAPARRNERKPYYAATRVGMKKVTVPLDPAMRRALKRLAVDTETSVETLIREAIAELLARRQQGDA